MSWLGVVLFVHALSAATQDVAIDALCISVTDETERGQLNGWMQSGMLAGRAAMGGGALVLGQWMGDAAVVVILISITTFSGGLLSMSRLPVTFPAESSTREDTHGTIRERLQLVLGDLAFALKSRRTWIGMLFALTGPAAYKAFEVVIGPFLIDHGFTRLEVGKFTAVVMIGAMVLGSIVGGQLADRFGRRNFVAVSLLFIIGCLSALAVTDLAADQANGLHLQVLIAATAFGIGLFTVALYAMYMDMTMPAIAATQFSAFMGATNGCESWSTFAMGRLVGRFGYPVGILTLAAVSLFSLPLLLGMGRERERSPAQSRR